MRRGRAGVRHHRTPRGGVRAAKSASVATGAKRLHSMEKPSRAIRGSSSLSLPCGRGRGRVGHGVRRMGAGNGAHRGPPPTLPQGERGEFRSPLTASLPAALRCVAWPSGRCLSAPERWSAPARSCPRRSERGTGGDLRRGRFDIDARACQIDVAAAISSSLTITAPPRVARTRANTSPSRIGCAIASALGDGRPDLGGDRCRCRRERRGDRCAVRRLGGEDAWQASISPARSARQNRSRSPAH
jgi:hypothetical protein